jgi:hypothetical protein
MLRILTVKIIQWFSFTAPQHPKKDTMNTMAPTAMSNAGAEKNLSSRKEL